MEAFTMVYPRFSVIMFLLFIVMAHLFATGAYRVRRNTISDLGAQGYRRKAIMQAGFLLFGVSVAAGVVLNGNALRTLPLGIYGASIAFTGIFCTKPFEDSVQGYSVLQDRLHSLFATLAGFCFCAAIALQAMFSATGAEAGLHLLFLGVVTALSILFGLTGNFRGLVQRGLYLVSLYWLGWVFRP